MAVEVRFIRKERNNEKGETTYWFEFNGSHCCIEKDFEKAIYGLIESDWDEETIINADNQEIWHKDFEAKAVRNIMPITDAIRRQ